MMGSTVVRGKSRPSYLFITFPLQHNQLFFVCMYVCMYVYMTYTIHLGEVEGTVEFTGADTSLVRLITARGTNETSNLQKTLVGIVLVLTIVISYILLNLFDYLLTILSVDEAMSFTVVLLVTSIPMAIGNVTTTTLGYQGPRS